MPTREEEDGCSREIVPYPRMRGFTRIEVWDEGSGISIVVNTTGPSDGSAYPFFCSLSLWDARYGRPAAAFSALGAASQGSAGGLFTDPPVTLLRVMCAVRRNLCAGAHLTKERVDD